MAAEIPAKLILLNVEGLDPSLFSLLSEEEQKRYNRYLKQEDRLLHLGSRLLMKKVLGDKKLAHKRNGKPYLIGGPHFSLTHSYPYVGLLLCPGCSVGVDLETKERLGKSEVEAFFHEQDRLLWQDPGLLWCLKEAVYKCRSKGYFNPKEPVIPWGVGIVKQEKDRFFYKSFEDERLLIVAASKKKLDIQFEEVGASFLP